MITDAVHPAQVPASPPTAFARVATQLDTLVAAFGLAAEAPLIGAVFEALCRRSLAFPLGGRPAAPSRLNEDGTPLQFATLVGVRPAALRFVADPGPLEAEGRTRMTAARAEMREAAELIGVEAELDAVGPLLAELAPDDAPALRSDRAGAFWIGAAFAPGAAARLRVYVNGSWGTPAAQWARLDRFAQEFERADAWTDLARQLPPALAPLGLALTLSPGGYVRGAIYLRAFGLRVAEYAALAGVAAGPAGAERIGAFGAAILGTDVALPTPSAVLSFAFGPEPGLATELELCAHCLFRDDDAARVGLERVFALAGLESEPYDALARALGPPTVRRGPPHLHSFIGVDAKAAGPAYSVYMKPDLSLP